MGNTCCSYQPIPQPRTEVKTQEPLVMTAQPEPERVEQVAPTCTDRTAKILDAVEQVPQLSQEDLEHKAIVIQSHVRGYHAKKVAEEERQLMREDLPILEEAQPTE